MNSQGGNRNVDDDAVNSTTPSDDTKWPELRPIDKYIKASCSKLSVRYTVALMACLGFVITFGMRSNYGLAMIHVWIGSFFEPHYGWDDYSVADSVFFCGYFGAQIPGGILALKLPANRIFGAAIACLSFLNLLVPLAINFHLTLAIIVRLIQGCVEGVTVSACHGLWRFWAPPYERSMLASIPFSGSYAGILISMLLSRILAFNVSWQAPFYFYSCAGLLWYVFWLWLVFEKPKHHPTISLNELEFIENSLGKSSQLNISTKTAIPWFSFLRSMPLYAIIVASFCHSWNFYLLILYRSSFFNDMFGFDIFESGLLSALPFFIMTIVIPFGGWMADYIRKKEYLSTTNVRKLLTGVGLGMESIFFLVASQTTTVSGAITAFTLGSVFSGFAISGYNVNHLDIAPRYASILIGLSQGFGMLAGFICPIVVETYISGVGWTIIFIVTACINFFGVIFYGIFASGELQKWAEQNTDAKSPLSSTDDDLSLQRKGTEVEK